MPLNDETLLENKPVLLTESYEDALKKEDVENETKEFIAQSQEEQQQARAASCDINIMLAKNIEEIGGRDREYEASCGGKPANEGDENNDPPKAA